MMQATGVAVAEQRGAALAEAELDPRDLAVADDVAMAMVRLFRMSACVHAQMAKSGMDRPAFVLLAVLVTEGPLRSSVLADAVHADASTVSRQVAQLVKDGLVERRADPQDGRATVLAATAGGVELLERQRRNRNLAIGRILASWPLEDRRRLAELFERFTADYERHLPLLFDQCARLARTEEHFH
jgi:DNA-binding MarR family transcriptional regulator